MCYWGADAVNFLSVNLRPKKKSYSYEIWNDSCFYEEYLMGNFEERKFLEKNKLLKKIYFGEKWLYLAVAAVPLIFHNSFSIFFIKKLMWNIMATFFCQIIPSYRIDRF